MDDKQLREFIKKANEPEHIFLLENSRAYKEGFEATEDVNPYKFPSSFSAERVRLSGKEPFTKEDGEMLIYLNSLFSKCDWKLWSEGYWYGHEN